MAPLRQPRFTKEKFLGCGAQVKDNLAVGSAPTKASNGQLGELVLKGGVILLAVILTCWITIDVLHSRQEQKPAQTAVAAGVSMQPQPYAAGPDPAAATSLKLGLDQLPPGGPFTLQGQGEYRTVGQAKEKVGTGTSRLVRYQVQIENGVDASSYGGDDAVAALVDATLADPRSWIHDSQFAFQHVAADQEADLVIQLSSAQTIHESCGVEINIETNCFTTDGNRVLLNEARWVRGSKVFDGDLGSYRQYVINHEVGHALGYAHHQPCTEDGGLAPVMMQQTLALNNSELHQLDPEEVYPDDNLTCRYNPWPFPKG